MTTLAQVEVAARDLVAVVTFGPVTLTSPGPRNVPIPVKWLQLKKL